MLAIDRLKKLKLAAKRSAQQNAELFQPSPLPAAHYESHTSPSVLPHSSSKHFIGPQKSPSFFVASNSDGIYERPGDRVYAAQSHTLMTYQPEMVAIRVKRSSNVQSPAVYDVPMVSPGLYESFHGVPVQDTRLVSPYSDTNYSRMRHASDDCASTPCSNTTHSMTTPAPLGSGSVTAHVPSCRGSAPSTLLHMTSRLKSSAATPKKIPPLPPQRTNSVKANNSPLLADRNGSYRSRSVDCDSLDRISKKNWQLIHCAVDIVPAVGATQSASATSSPATVMSVAADSGSIGDCSTLPFANENMGTIRQRGSLNASSATYALNDSDDEISGKPVYDEYSGTVRRRGMFYSSRVKIKKNSLMVSWFSNMVKS